MRRIAFTAALLLLLANLLLPGCSTDQVTRTPQPIDKATYDKMLTTLEQGEFVKLATHFRNREEINTYMQDRSDTFLSMGSMEENGLTYDDYNPINRAVVVGLSLVFETKTGMLKEVGVGLSPAVAKAAEEILAGAVFSQDEKSEPPFLSKKTYYFGYLPVGEDKLDITMEKTTLPDKALYSIIYQQNGG
ncbi:MAG: hypothetical protein AB1568_09920 [Thermodesulfobacteriota bacterium]